MLMIGSLYLMFVTAAQPALMTLPVEQATIFLLFSLAFKGIKKVEEP